MEQRDDAVVAVIRDGMAVSEVAAKLGISRQSLYRWLARHEEGGLEALEDRSHRPGRISDLGPRVLRLRTLAVAVGVAVHVSEELAHRREWRRLHLYATGKHPLG